jgi:hypothetical protein
MKFTSLVLSTLLGLALSEPIPVPRAPTADPDPTQVWIEEVTYGGTGCPQGTASISLASDRKSFTVILDAYIASAGPGYTITDSRKNCQLNIQLHYPGGFQYSIFSSDYRGFVDLESGVTGIQKATYYFAGQTKQSSTQTTFTGPKSEDYLIHDEIPFDSTVWSPCGEYAGLNINSQVRVDAGSSKTAKGFLTTDSVDGKVVFKAGVQWQPCTK